MSGYNKDLPDWAKVGAQVLISSGSSEMVSTIERVTKTSAFLKNGERYVVPSKYSDKKSLELYGRGDSWSLHWRSIRPLDSEEARGIIAANRRRQKYVTMRDGLEHAIGTLKSARYGRNVDEATITKAIDEIEAAIAAYRQEG